MTPINGRIRVLDPAKTLYLYISAMSGLWILLRRPVGGAMDDRNRWMGENTLCAQQGLMLTI